MQVRGYLPDMLEHPRLIDASGRLHEAGPHEGIASKHYDKIVVGEFDEGRGPGAVCRQRRALPILRRRSSRADRTAPLEVPSFVLTLSIVASFA
jgi:hypothetical protein